MDVRVVLLLIMEAALALVLLRASGVLPTPKHVLISSALLAAAFVLRGLCLSYETLDYQNFLAVWVDFFRQNGGLAALGMPIGNYNVPYLFFLALFSQSSIPDLYLIKLLSIFFDVVLAWSAMQLAGCFVRASAQRLACFFLVLFWPTVVLNGALWGQCDSIYVAFAVLSVWLALSGHPMLAMASIAVSFSFKLQAVFVMPVFLLFLLARRIKIWHFLVFPPVCVLMVLPAVLAGRPLWESLTISLSQTGSIGDGLNYNSPSVFALFSDVQNPELAGKLGILAAALVIVLLAILVWRRRDSCSNRALLLSAALLAVAIPFFLPHMHERYFFAADILTLALALVDLRLTPLPLLCEFASLLGYHAYLKMRYLLLMSWGAWALIAVMTVLTVLLLIALFFPEKKLYRST